MKKRTSIIWKISRQDLEIVVAESQTLTEILKKFNLVNKGRNSHTLKARLYEDKIDFSHIPLGLNTNKGRHFHKKNKIPIKNILKKNSNYSRTSLKKRLIKEKYLEEKCYICGINPLWNEKKLSLQLDHINGIWNDNRLKNLRLLCPNCHSQTDSFCGKNNK